MFTTGSHHHEPTTGARSSRRLAPRLVTAGICLGLAGTLVAAGSSAQAATGTAATTTGSGHAVTAAAQPTVPSPKPLADTGQQTPHFGALVPAKPYLAPKGLARQATVTVPASVNLRPWAVQALNQGSINSCVGWALGYALMGWEAKHAGLGDLGFAPYDVYSQLNGGQNVGIQPASALPILRDYGVDVTPHYWQQAAGNYWTGPDPGEQANALQYRITGFSQLAPGATIVNQIESALAAGNPVPISLFVRAGLTNYANVTDQDSTSPILLDTLGNKESHEVLLVGYDSEGVTFQNSWGPTYKDQGFGKLTWSVVQTDLLTAFKINGFSHSAIGGSDTTGPTVAAPNTAIETGSLAATDGTARFDTTFSASDPSGMGATFVDVSVDGGAYQQMATNTYSTVTNLAPGHTYRFAAAAYDARNNWSGWSYGTAFGVGSYPELNAGMTWSTGWSTSSWASAVGGGLVVSGTAGATATFSFTGRTVTWVATKATNRGQAYVYADGAYQGTFDLYAASTQARDLVATTTWASSGAHTLTIKVVGTSGRPTIDVDDFIVTN